MKNIAKILLGVCSSALILTGCIEETFPTDVATTEQLGSSSKATEALLWAMPAYTNKYDQFGMTLEDEEPYHFDYGYGSIMHIRDIMTEDMAIASSSYNAWYNAWIQNQTIGDSYVYPQYVWNYYWKFVQTTNNLISAIDPASATNTQLGYLGAGYAFRAFLYLDMAQMFEFLENDGTSAPNVLNLTVPIVRETTTEEEARNNPRAPHSQMFDFILSDLNMAERNIVLLSRTSKTLPDLSVVYGLKARLYLWDKNYAEAKNYARKAIDASGCTPTTESQWLSTTSGFNELSTPSWMWGSQMQKEDEVVQSGILNWTSWSSNEATYGYAGAGVQLMIGASLYSRISNTDFRKLSWKAPENSPLYGQNQYVDAAFGASLLDYASLKFRPGSGNGSDYNVGSACAYPLMRVEEMYFIEAEAAAHLKAADGIALVNDFMKKYRDSQYECKVTDTDEVVEEILFQKRIELWGEGLTFFDIKRLDMSVTRGYEGTNFSDATRFNTDGRPAWMNICIVKTEGNNNSALVGYGNPDPSNCYPLWNGQ